MMPVTLPRAWPELRLRLAGDQIGGSSSVSPPAAAGSAGLAGPVRDRLADHFFPPAETP